MRSELERKYVAVIYSLMSARLFIEPMLGMFMPSTLLRFLELGVICAIAFFLVMFLLHARGFRYGVFQTIILASIAIVSLYMIVRGDFSGGVKGLIFTINGDTKVLAYLMPFAILILPNVKYFQTILNVLFYSSLLAVPLWLINADSLVRDTYFGESIGVYFPFYAAFLLGLIHRFSLRKRLAIIAVYAFYLLLMVLNARRNVTLSLGVYASIAAGFYFFANVRNIKHTLIALGVGALFVLFLTFNFSRLSEGILSNILDRGLEDSRSQVELLYLADLAASPLSDAIIGRGMDGTYYQITQDHETNETSTDREVIETGYLHMMLKGGLVYVLLIIVILTTTVVCGFRSGNRDIYYLSAILVTYYIDMYTTNPVAIFNVRSIIFWFTISVCLQYHRLKTVFQR